MNVAKGHSLVLLSLFQGWYPSSLGLLLLAAVAFKPSLSIFDTEFTIVISRKVSPIKATLSWPKTDFLKYFPDVLLRSEILAD